MFQVSASELRWVMRLLGRFVAKKTTVPALSCVHVRWNGDTVEWSVTDLDAWLTVTRLTKGDGEGAVCLPYRLLADLAGCLDPEGVVEFAQDGEQVILQTGRAQCRLKAIPADEFPERPEAGARLATVPAQVFAHALRRVAPCSAEWYATPALTAVCWQHDVMVATDGMRMAVLQGVPRVEHTLLLSGQTMGALAGMLPQAGYVHVFSGEADRQGFVLLTWADGDGEWEYLLAVRQVAAQYPEWRYVVPTTEPAVKAVVDRHALMAAIKRLAIFERESKFPVVTLRFARGGIVVQAAGDIGGGEEEVVCEELVGDRFALRAHVRLVLDGLRLAETHLVEVRSWGVEAMQEIREVREAGGDECDWRYYWLPLRREK